MNILPKKNWHVRNKDNIARVRRDEKKAEEELKEAQRRAKLAEQEARTAILRERARARMGASAAVVASEADGEEKSAVAAAAVASVTNKDGHVNFFTDLEAGETTHTDNKDRDKEEKAEQEEYEKKIGLLVYLGQDTNELTGERSWWEKIPEDRKKTARDEKDNTTEVVSKAKVIHSIKR